MRFLIVFLAAIHVTRAQEIVYVPGLVAAYSFTQNANDSGPNGYHGTGKGVITFNDTLSVPNDYNSFVLLPSRAFDGLRDFTIYCKFKLFILNPDLNLIFSGATPNNSNHFTLYYIDWQGKWGFSYQNINYVFDALVPTPNKWHCLTFTRKSNAFSLYIDGIRAANDLILDDLPLNLQNTGIVLGQEQDCVGGCFDSNQNLNGKIDNFCVFNRVLLPSEITKGCLDPVTVTAVPPAASPDLGKDTILCSGSLLNLDAGTWKSYRWSTGDTSRFTTVAVTGTFWVEVSDGNHSNRDSVRVTFLPATIANLGEDRLLCDQAPVVLQAGNPGASYQWSTGATTPTLPVATSGTYWVEIRNGRCIDRDTVVVRYNGVYDLVAEASKIMVPSQELIQFSVNATGITSWSWDFGDGEAAFSPNPMHTYSEAGEYLVIAKATNQLGCTGIDTLHIRIVPYLNIPNVFTPNDDGYNDAFHVQYNGKETYALTVYDRRGKEVFASANRKVLWNGNGHANGLYYFLLRVGHLQYKGWVHLLR